MAQEKRALVTLKIRLLERGWDYRDLAKATKRNPRYVANVISGNDPWWPVRAAINRALGEKIFTKRPPSRAGRKAKNVATKTAAPSP
jgi:hypothetical protein